MPTRPQPSPAPAVRKTANYKLMDPWMPENRRSRKQLEEYPREHACGFCGAKHFAHRSTRISAILFCSAACAKSYKDQRARPRKYRSRIGSGQTLGNYLRETHKQEHNQSLIRDLLAANTSFRTTPWMVA